MSKTIRIILADDHRMIREALAALLRAEPGVEVVGEADDGRGAVAMAGELGADVVVMDINMPGLNGIEATRQIRSGRNGDGPKVVALSAHKDRRFVAETFKAGASAYLLKESAFEELAVALRAVADHKTYVSPAVAGVVVQDFVAGAEGEAGVHPPAFASLSSREREVMQLVAEGKATKEVAAILHVSVKTVETHRRNIMDKLGIESVAELTKYAIREGLTGLET